MSKSLVIKAPWPPSVNTYWRRNGNTYFISPKGVKYRYDMMAICAKLKGYFKPTQKLQLLIEAYPPDKRKRDLDNILKSILDSLGKKAANVYDDDSQIDKLTVWRCLPLTGEIVITLSVVE